MQAKQHVCRLDLAQTLPPMTPPLVSQYSVLVMLDISPFWINVPQRCDFLHPSHSHLFSALTLSAIHITMCSFSRPSFC